MIQCNSKVKVKRVVSTWMAKRGTYIKEQRVGDQFGAGVFRGLWKTNNDIANAQLVLTLFNELRM